MAVKDFGLREDASLSEKEGHDDGTAKEKEAPPDDPNPQIKNAHATGDGSYGRNREEEVEGKDGDRKESY